MKNCDNKIILCLEVIMNIEYFKKIIKNVEKYDKKATNPFLQNQFENNPFKSIYEQTYIWVTKERE